MAENAFLNLVRYVRAIPKADIDEVRRVAQQQADYTSDTRVVYAAEQRALGTFNLQVAQKVEELRELMRTGPERVIGSKLLPINAAATKAGDAERLQ